MAGAPRNPDGSVTWEQVISGWNPKSGIPGIRESGAGLQYDTSFMLLLFTHDVQELMNRGWSFPGYDDIDWSYINDLTTPPSSPENGAR